MSVLVQGITKRFTTSGTPAVEDVSLTAPTGCITTLLGPSGSGKSTVLRVIAGLEAPEVGRVFFADAEVTHAPVQQRGVGFVFQSYALFKHMTVRENVAFGLKLRRLPKPEIQRRTAELLGLVQLAGLGDRFPMHLSGGQRQRVAFARAMAIEPKVLLLDEPFGALDAQVRLELRDWLRRFHEERHVTTILVTHDQEEAMELSHHVVVMHQGRVEQAGSPQDVYDRPETPFVAAFVGGANVLRGRVSAGKAEVGTFAVAAPVGAREGAPVHAFVRPHDVELAKAGDDAVSVARVERLVVVGGHVKVFLRLPDGGSMTVEMARAETERLAIAEGDRVMVNLHEAKVFVEDYSI